MTQDATVCFAAEGFTNLREVLAGGMVRTFAATEERRKAEVVLRAYGESPEASGRMQAEARFLADHGEGVLPAPARVLPEPGNALVFHDVPADPLPGLPIRDVAVFLDLAIGMTRALEVLHRHGALHLALHPRSFLCDRTGGKVWLVDLGSSCLPLPRQSMAPLYASPETSAATRWKPGPASDLYSLGAIFFHLLTGAPPFEGDTEQAIVHAHLTRMPRSLDEDRPDLPAPLVRLVNGVLAKDPERRCPSAQRMLQELNRVKEQEAVPSVPAAQPPDYLDLPHALYGREAELTVLQSALEASREGRMQVAMVTGRSGTGKTALVERFFQANKEAMILGGKFDRASVAVPYSAVSFAFNSAVHRLLAMPAEEMERRRQAMTDALEGNGAVIASLVPDLEMLLGPQRSPPTLGPVENQRRFRNTVCAFVRSLASREHPLILLVDDLQWADRSSVELLLVLLAELQDAPLFIIGAYRDDEVDAGHLVQELLRAGRQMESAFRMVSVADLDQQSACGIFAEMLGDAPASVAGLARAACDITHGNALHLIELLKQLHAAQRLSRDRDGAWFWQQAQEDVARLGTFRGSVHATPQATREVLASAACLGDQFEPGLLADVCRMSREALDEVLEPAISAQLLVWTESATGARRLAFRHDKVRDAAGEVLSEDQRRQICWRAARSLHERMDPANVTELFRAARYYNEARASFGSSPQQVAVAEVNLQAARIAHRSTAYLPAIDFLAQARAWLSRDGEEDPWERDHDLCMAVHKQLVESNYLAGRFEATQREAGEALDHATGALDAADVHRMLTIMHTIQSDYEEAIEIGRRGLLALGIDLPRKEYAAHLDKALQDARAALAGRSIESLIDMAECQDLEGRLRMRMLVDIAPAAWLCNPALYAVIVARSAALSLAEGISDQSANIFATYGLILATERGENQAGYAFGKLGMAFAERFDNDADRCKTACIFGAHINHWVAPVHEAVPICADGWSVGARSGEIQWAGYISQWWVVNLFSAGVPIPEVLHRVELLLHYNISTKHELIVDTLEGCQSIFRQLSDPDVEPKRWQRFNDFDSRFVARCENHNSGLSLCNYFVFKALLMVLKGDHDAALVAIEGARRNAGFSRGTFTLGEIPFLRALATIGRARDEGRQLAEADKALLSRDGEELAGLADSAPGNFLCRRLLLDAELLDLSGEPKGAAYDAAVEEARRCGFVQIEALALELAGRSCLRRGMSATAQALVTLAVQAYQGWGAACKVALLQSEFPMWAQPGTPALTPLGSMPAATLETLVKASTNLTADLDLNNVLERALRLAMEYAGASRGGLFFKTDGDWRVGAAATARHGGVAALDPRKVWPPGQRPGQILEYVARTREPLIWEEGDPSGRFAGDSYIKAASIRSALCLPLILKDQVVALLFAENSLVPGAFRTERITLLRMLLVHMAIAIENSGLFERVKGSEARARESEERLRSFLDNAMTVAWMKDDEGRYVFVSGGYERAFGLSADHWQGRTDFDVWPEEVARGLVANDREVLAAGRPMEVVEETENRQGKRQYWRILKFPFWDAQGKRYVGGLGVDITERRAVEEERERLSQILESTSDLVSTATPDAHLTYLNRAGRAMVGWTGDEPLEDRSIPDLHPQWALRVITEAGLPRARDEGAWRGETALLHRDGTEIPVSQVILSHKGPDGAVLYYSTIMRDMSEQRRLEHRIRQGEKMEAIGQLAGGIAHDFNNQLGGVLGFADLLALKLTDPALMRYAEKIRTSAQRAADLTQQLLAFARKGTYVPTQVDMHGVIGEAISMLQRSIDKRIEIKAQLDAGQSIVVGDQAQLVGALLNLGLNARDAMPEGGTMVIASRTAELTTKQADDELPPGRYVEVSVTDTGIGMDEQTRSRVFEPFFTTKEVGKGTGLGLASVYGTVKSHRGAIRVYSEPGRGSCFKVYLPVAEEVALPTSPAEPAAGFRGEGSILLVDDEEVVLDVAREMLTDLGYTVSTCQDPLQALDLYRKDHQTFDLVMLDMVMPRMNGRDLFARMRRINPKVRAILCSGYPINGEARGILDLGAIGFLQKPFSQQQLSDTVAKVFRKNETAGPA